VPPVAAAPSSSTLAQTGAAPWVALLGIGLLGAFLLVRRLRFGRA
jgi:LPXTG-motif cell wall-anchored protein